VKGLLQAGDRYLWSTDQLHAAAVGELGAAEYSTVFRAVPRLATERLIHRIVLGDDNGHY